MYISNHDNKVGRSATENDNQKKWCDLLTKGKASALTDNGVDDVAFLLGMPCLDWIQDPAVWEQYVRWKVCSAFPWEQGSGSVDVRGGGVSDFVPRAVWGGCKPLTGLVGQDVVDAERASEGGNRERPDTKSR
ncbi:hypothetical protein LIER_31653 [Lithospermum erythrorhizon]|uniref:Uncharacterized protein n=1 Tax=Lithospermum erythrorhizon TaxID=34254 RepID=A0AAV3RUR1_LITER